MSESLAELYYSLSRLTADYMEAARKHGNAQDNDPTVMNAIHREIHAVRVLIQQGEARTELPDSAKRKEKR